MLVLILPSALTRIFDFFFLSTVETLRNIAWLLLGTGNFNTPLCV